MNRQVPAISGVLMARSLAGHLFFVSWLLADLEAFVKSKAAWAPLKLRQSPWPIGKLKGS